MSVNVLGSNNLYANMSYGAYKQKLTPATRQKLEELGISFNEDTTETEGKALIKRYENRNSDKVSEENINSQNSSNQDNSLLEKAINLAKRIGLSIDSKEKDVQLILSKIEQQLNQQLQENENNISELKRIKQFSIELANIQTEANSQKQSGSSNNEPLMMSLEMLSEYNKNFLNQ